MIRPSLFGLSHETLFFIAVAIVIVGTIGIRHLPKSSQGAASLTLMAAIFFVIGFLLWALIEPLEPVSQTIAIIVAVLACAYGLWRFVELVDERRR